MADDFFSLLTAGTRFKHKRGGLVPANAAVKSAIVVSVPSHASEPTQNVDDQSQHAVSRRSQKRKKAQTQDARAIEMETVEGISMFSRRSVEAAGADVQGAASSSGEEEEDDDNEHQHRTGDSAKGDRTSVLHSRNASGPASTSQAHHKGTAVAAAAAAGPHVHGQQPDNAAAFSDASCPMIQTKDPMEQANVLRKTFRIKAVGTDVPDPLRSFGQLAALPGGRKRRGAARLLARLVDAGWTEPTPVQRQAISCLLAGRELLAVAPTGSGKTLAFLMPILLALQAQRASGKWPDAPKAVVMSPTAELAAQQSRVLDQLLPGSRLRSRLLNKSTAAGSDFSKVDIVVANPLRLATLAGQGKLSLAEVRWLVLDEADKLFELGFMEQVDAVLAAATHPRLVRALFSATLPEKVEDLARSVLQQPLRITVGVRNAAVDSVKQRLVFAGREAGKLMALRQLITSGLTPPVLVFVASKDRAKELHRELMYDGVHVDSITADQSAAARSAAVDNFRSGRTWLLIATDLIGRGMDFVAVSTVVNYDFPGSSSDYIHRVGRTGRAGRSGEAITFFTEEDAGKLRTVANIIKASGGDVPAWMLALKKGRTGRSSSGSGAAAGGSGAREFGEAVGGPSHNKGSSRRTILTEPHMDRDKRKRRKQSIESSKQKATARAADGAAL